MTLWLSLAVPHTLEITLGLNYWSQFLRVQWASSTFLLNFKRNIQYTDLSRIMCVILFLESVYPYIVSSAILCHFSTCKFILYPILLFIACHFLIVALQQSLLFYLLLWNSLNYFSTVKCLHKHYFHKVLCTTLFFCLMLNLVFFMNTFSLVKLSNKYCSFL